MTRQVGDTAAPPLVRVARRTLMEGECLVWQGNTGSNGYGLLTIDGGKVNIHRWMYLQLVGPIPPGMHLDHLCRNRACWAPWHLEIVTPAENAARGAIAQRATCYRGHPWDEPNTRWASAKHSPRHRECRTCRRMTPAERAAHPIQRASFVKPRAA